MSQSGSDKTEKPTPRRIRKAREQGQVAKSTDFNSALVLGAATCLMVWAGQYLYNNLHAMLSTSLQHLAVYGKTPITQASFAEIYRSTAVTIFWTLLPILMSVSVMGIFSNLIQVRPMFSPMAIMPKFDKINPLNGIKRIVSTRSVVEVIKAIFKMGMIGWISYLIINAHLGQLLSTTITSVEQTWIIWLETISQIALWSVACYFVIGMADWRFQAWQLEKQLMMTRQEVKDERKNEEGDPMIKNRIRQMGIQMAKKRQLAEVPTADVIITNPTHFAIAVKYDPDICPAPMVVAKGVDHFALKIREVAKESGVPIVENKPLARTLYKVAEASEMIPPELFIAVAEILAYVYSKNKGRRLKRKTPVKSLE